MTSASPPLPPPPPSPWIKVGKITAFSVAGLLVVLALGYGLASWKVSRQAGRVLQVEVKEIAIPSDPASLAEGKRLAQVKACMDCHGQDWGGKVFIQDPAIGTFAGTNLTPAGAAKNYTDRDWIRAIRHGLSPEGKFLRFMPSDEFHGLSDQDLGRMIAYLKSVPPVTRENVAIQVGPMAKVLYSAGQFPLLFPGERIENLPPPPVEVNSHDRLVFGQYVAQACTGCHGATYQGGKIPGTPPEWPPASDLRPSGPFARYDFDQFKRTLTTGVTIDGKKLNPQYMPWPSFAAMTEDELEALYDFLTALPKDQEIQN